MKRDDKWMHAARVAPVLLACALGLTGVFAQQGLDARAVKAAPSKALKIEILKSSARSAAQLDPNALGDFSQDNVYTAVTPCRIVDTRRFSLQAFLQCPSLDVHRRPWRRTDRRVRLPV